MNAKTTNGRARWLGRPRETLVLIVMISAALVTAACSSNSNSPSATSSPTSAYAKMVAYAQCIRAHGVRNYPDPNSNGVTNANGLNLHSAQMQSAAAACKKLAPVLSGQGQNAAGNAGQMLKFAQCMRAHGVTKFPDPSSNGTFHIGISSGINPQSPTFVKAQQSCQSLMPQPQSGG